MDDRNRRIYTPRGNISIWRSLGFGVTDMLGGGFVAIVGAWLLFFYTTYAGLTATEGASILALAKFLDAFTSLIMGNLTDELWRTKIGRRFGRRHFFLLIGIPLTLEFSLIWIGGMTYWYYLFSYLLFEIIVAMITIPWETLPNEMTTDYVKRTKLSSTRLVISGTATFLATFIPGQLFRVLGQNSALPFFINGLLFAIIFSICVAISWGTTWERFIDEREGARLRAGEEKFTLKNAVNDYFSTLKIKSFRQHLLIYLCSFTAMDTWSAVFVYFIVSDLHKTTTLAANIQSLSLFGIPITILLGWLFTKTTPRKLFFASYTLIIISNFTWLAIWKLGLEDTLVLLIIAGLIYQFGKSGLTFIPWNLFPFIPDLDELVTGKKRAGVFAAVMVFVRKSTVAVATFIVGILLDASGYVKGQINQSVSSQNMIGGILVFGVSILILISLIIAMRFKLDQKSHKIIIDEIKRLNDGGNMLDATDKTKDTVKELTGIDYSSIPEWNKTNISNSK
ncbi:MFS transporter [Levilactobacillus sp. HBUAS70063]|uniref:MFS transporter n=1 Tax=Levilactobacillus sp. HBUAS70063 TaxID=3109359 RepID=UPI003132986E